MPVALQTLYGLILEGRPCLLTRKLRLRKIRAYLNLHLLDIVELGLGPIADSTPPLTFFLNSMELFFSS